MAKELLDHCKEIGLDAETSTALHAFSLALADKLRNSEIKHGFGHGWKDRDLVRQFRRELLTHVGKGDPRDVAAYAMFLWFLDASTIGS